jgi:hypothetical protein
METFKMQPFLACPIASLQLYWFPSSHQFLTPALQRGFQVFMKVMFSHTRLFNISSHRPP